MKRKVVAIILCLLAAYILFIVAIRERIRTAKPVGSVEAARPVEYAGPVRIGDEARNFTLTSSSGEQIDLDSFKNKSIVLICVGNPYT